MYELVTWDAPDGSVIVIGSGVEGKDIPKTIKDEHYKGFLDMCFEHSDSFSLQVARWAASTDDNVQEELEPYRIKTMQTLKWFGYDYTNAPEGDQRPMEVSLYRATAEAKAVLLKCFDDIFLNEKKGDRLVQSTQTVEDLCFFKDEALWVGTVSHENMLCVFPPDEGVVPSLDAFGDWKYIMDEEHGITGLDELTK